MYEELANILLYDAGWLEQGITQTEHDIAEHLKKAADAIEELSKPRWIPVTERLPEDGEDVLCWISDKRRPGQGFGTVGCYNSIVTLWDLDADWASSLDITHWRTLPEPPKEEA